MGLNTLGDSQQATAIATFTDKKGNPATINTVPTWASSDTTLLTVDASGDPTGLTAVVKAVGPLGTATISVTDTPSDGSSPVVLTGDVQVVAEGAISGNVSLGTPTEQ